MASHTVGGFKQSMSFARHFCRSCMATKDESRNHFTANLEHQKSIISDTTAEKSTDYGINGRSILNDVLRFSVIGGLCHDIMHDMLEGALPYELRLLLQHLFNTGDLNLQEYNDGVKAFDYGYTETANKPNEIPICCFYDKLKLRYSASEKLLIARILRYIIGDKVPEDDMHYKCFLMLLKILNIVMSPYIIHEVPPYLRVLIKEHHSLFIELYPNESFILKLHYMIQYPKPCPKIANQGAVILI